MTALLQEWGLLGPHGEEPGIRTWKLRLRGAVVTTGATLLVLVAVACGGNSDGEAMTEGGPSATTIEGNLELGEEVFARDCAVCHGREGGGGAGPQLSDGRIVERYPDPRDHREVVVEGRGAMPAFGGRLSRDEIQAVVRYEREGL